MRVGVAALLALYEGFPAELQTHIVSHGLGNAILERDATLICAFICGKGGGGCTSYGSTQQYISHESLLIDRLNTGKVSGASRVSATYKERKAKDGSSILL